MQKLVKKMQIRRKSAEFCGLQGGILLFVNKFKGIINTMRDCWDKFSSLSTLIFLCAGGCMCAFRTQNTHTLKHTTTATKNPMAARAGIVSRCFFYRRFSWKNL